MKTINHIRNAIRFTIIVFWILILGLLYTAFTNSSNLYALSWVTLLLYAVGIILLLYTTFFVTIKLWNVK